MKKILKSTYRRTELNIVPVNALVCHDRMHTTHNAVTTDFCGNAIWFSLQKNWVQDANIDGSEIGSYRTDPNYTTRETPVRYCRPM
jgi:hypothetical protein